MNILTVLFLKIQAWLHYAVIARKKDGWFMHRDYVRHINDTKIEYGNHFVSIKGHSVGWNVFDLGQILGFFFFALGLADQVFWILITYSYHSHSYVSWYSGQLVSVNLPTNHCSNSTSIWFFYMVYLQLRFAFKTSFMKNSCNPILGILAIIFICSIIICKTHLIQSTCSLSAHCTRDSIRTQIP